SGTAAQFTATKGPLRPLIRCTHRAIISLPVPVSPRMRIGMDRATARLAMETALATAGSLHTNPGLTLSCSSALQPSWETDHDLARFSGRYTRTFEELPLRSVSCDHSVALACRDINCRKPVRKISSN